MRERERERDRQIKRDRERVIEEGSNEGKIQHQPGTQQLITCTHVLESRPKVPVTPNIGPI